MGIQLFAIVTAVAIGLASPIGSALAQDQGNDDELINATVLSECTDGKPAMPTQYLVALHSGHARSIREGGAAAPNAVFGNILIWVMVGGKLQPIALHRQNQPKLAYYLIDCSGGIGLPDQYPGLQIEPVARDKAAPAEGDKEAMLDLLRRKVASGDPNVVLFSGANIAESLVPWPSTTAESPSYGKLLQDYTRQLAPESMLTFLNGYNGPAKVRSLESGSRDRVVDLTRLGPRRESDAPPARPAPTVTPPAALGVAGQASPPAAAPTEPMELRVKQKIPVRFSVAHRGLMGLDLAQPGQVETFGHCGTLKREPSAAGAQQIVYAFEECEVDDRLQVPLRIGRLEILVLKLPQPPADRSKAAPAPVRIDGQLRTHGYSVAYPPPWQRAATDRVDIPPGTLDELTKHQVRLSQAGLPGCQTTVSPSAADVLAEGLTFPSSLPCQRFDLVLPANLFAKKAHPRVQGCLPGGGDSVVASNGRVGCLTTAAEAKASKKLLPIEWAPGFRKIDLDVSLPAGGDVPWPNPFEWLKAALPEQAAATAGAKVPVYRVLSTSYLVGGQPCGKPMPPEKDGTAATIAQSGCDRLPDRVAVTYEIDLERSDRSVPLEAFSTTVQHMVVLGAGAVPQAFNAASQRLKLAIAFSPDRQDKYAREFVEPADLVIKGARVYRQAGCAEPERIGEELFARRGAKAEYEWPVYAQVFDNDGRPLTNCATSILERSADSLSYLTFDFVGSRAVGARRAILIARSQELMNTQGLAQSIEGALRQLIAAAADRHKRGAPLSPIDVFSVAQDGSMRHIFSGEDAALESQKATASILQLDRTGPRTPDFSVMRQESDTKNADRMLFVMDGSHQSKQNVDQLVLLLLELSKKRGSGGLQFFLSSESCFRWDKQAEQPVRCVDLVTQPQNQREKLLADAFRSFLNPTTEGAARPQQPTAKTTIPPTPKTR